MPDPYDALRTELGKADYAGLTDAATVAALNAPGAARPQPVPAVWVATFFALNGLRGTIDDVSREATSPMRSACLGLIDFFWGVGAGRMFDVTDPSLAGMLQSFVDHDPPLMSAGQRDALVNLNAAPGPSVAQGLGFSRGVTVADLAAARSR